MSQRLRRSNIEILNRLEGDLRGRNEGTRLQAAIRIGQIGMAHPEDSAERRRAIGILTLRQSAEQNTQIRHQISEILGQLSPGYEPPRISVIPRRVEGSDERDEDSESASSFPRIVRTVARVAAHSALGSLAIPLLLLGQVSGCGPGGEVTGPDTIIPPQEEIPEEPQEEETPPQERNITHWWPAFRIMNGQLEQVYLGFDENEPMYVDWDRLYQSRDDIPADLVGETRTVIDSLVSRFRGIFDEEHFGPIFEGMLFYERPIPEPGPDDPVAAGSFGNARAVNVVNLDGEELSYCLGDGDQCMAMSYVHGHNPVVLIHESLHRVYFSLLRDADVSSLRDQALEFFNVYGADSDTDRFFNILRSGRFPGEENTSFNLDSMLRQWTETLEGLSVAERQELVSSIGNYVRIRQYVIGERTSEIYTTHEQREGFISEEAFAFMGANYDVINAYLDGSPTSGMLRLIPTYMRWIYEQAGIRGDLLDEMVTGGSYYETREDFQRLIPYIGEFADFMRGIYPQFENVLNPAE